MGKITLKMAAALYNGRSHSCETCTFRNRCTDEILELCSTQFKLGFMKGAEYQKKKVREEKNG